jgi:hypothetical protein
MANPPRPERELAIKMYADGHPYSEIRSATGADIQYLYATINREIRAGKLEPQRDPKKTLRRKVVGNVPIGWIGREVNKLSTEEIITLTSKMKRDESLAETLIRLALRGRR